MQVGVALCPPRCVFHSWLLFLRRLRQLSPCKTPMPFLGPVLIRLVLWVSFSSRFAPPFPAPSLWVRGRAPRDVLRFVRSPVLVPSPYLSVLTWLRVSNGIVRTFSAFQMCFVFPCSLCVGVSDPLVFLVTIVFRYVNVRRYCLASSVAWTDLTFLLLSTIVPNLYGTISSSVVLVGTL